MNFSAYNGYTSQINRLKTSLICQVCSMPSRAVKKEKKSSSDTPKALNAYVKNEIAKLSSQYTIEPTVLEDFAQFVIEYHKKKDLIAKTVKIKPLTLPQIKSAIYQYFNVKNTTELKKSGSFRMATDGMIDLNLGLKGGWEILYRKFVGVLPGEEHQEGYGCINGINIFNYFRPWQVFGLDPQTASLQDIKSAYYRLSKIYHPDNQETGDA
ncbi:MAG: J domain-containing protein, partial [Microcystaceae cyanobacterium]